jgi:hypothetical protein
MYRTTQKCLEQCGPCPVLAIYTLALAVQLREKQTIEEKSGQLKVLAVLSPGNISPETYLIAGCIDHRCGNGRKIYELARFIVL